MLLFPEAVGQIYNGQQTLVTLHLPSFRTSLGQRELHTQSQLDNFYFRKQKLHETISQTIFKVQLNNKGMKLRHGVYCHGLSALSCLSSSLTLMTSMPSMSGSYQAVTWTPSRLVKYIRSEHLVFL